MRDEDGAELPPWAGAPGYSPAPDLPAHAPMPGAPPYPAKEELPPPPVGEAAQRTRVLSVLAATAVWAAVDIVLVLLVGRPVVGVAFAAGLAVTLLVTAVGAGLLARRRAWSFPLLLAVTFPVFWVLRALVGAVLG